MNLLRMVKPEPHSYAWHDGHTSHYQHNALVKSETSIVPEVALTPFGQPGSSSTEYNLDGKLLDAEDLAGRYGYKTFLHGGRFPNPDYGLRNYDTGFLPIPDSDDTTRAYRVLHELAHALTHRDINTLYGEGRRFGPVSPQEAIRAVHWEDLAARKQRELASEIGVQISDESFNRERNRLLGDSVYRAATGTPLSTSNFAPHSHEVPLSVGLDLVRQIHENKNMTKKEKPIPSFRHKHSGKIVHTNIFHDASELPNGTSRSDYDEGFSVDGKFYTRAEFKSNKKLNKEEIGSGVTVEGFMAGLKALPKVGPMRGQYITRHISNPEFIAALQKHPQGKQVLGMLNAHLNSKANAATRGVVTAKSESGVISWDAGESMPTEDTLNKIKVLAEQIQQLRKREMAKAIIPPHVHNIGVGVSSGVEDVPPGKLNDRGASKVATREEPTTCKGCGKSECSCTHKTEVTDMKGNPKTLGVVTEVSTDSKEISADGSGGEIKRAKSLGKIRKAAMAMTAQKAEPPMAKPPSGVNMGTHVPTSAPAMPKPTIKGEGYLIQGGKLFRGVKDLREAAKLSRQITNQERNQPAATPPPPQGEVQKGAMEDLHSALVAHENAMRGENEMKARLFPAAHKRAVALMGKIKSGEIKSQATSPIPQNFGKGLMSDIAAREAHSGASTPVAPTKPAPMPSPQEQDDRAAMFAEAMGGAYAPPKPTPEPIAAPKARPGIFGKLDRLNRPK